MEFLIAFVSIGCFVYETYIEHLSCPMTLIRFVWSLPVVLYCNLCFCGLLKSCQNEFIMAKLILIFWQQISDGKYITYTERSRDIYHD